jgi:predicted PurR-regulated permease PerM
VSPRATAPTDFAEFAKRSLFIAALVGLGLLLWLLWPVLLLIFAAVLVAIALRSLAIPFARWTPLGMSAAVGVVMVLLVLVLSGTGLMLGVQLSDQLGELGPGSLSLRRARRPILRRAHLAGHCCNCFPTQRPCLTD